MSRASSSTASRTDAAKKLGIDPDKVHVVSPFVGGAFGSKAQLTPRTGLRRARRQSGSTGPSSWSPTRDQGFTIATYRAETRHHIRLGAQRDGKIVGFSHEGWEVTSRPDPYCVAGVEDSARLYAFGCGEDQRQHRARRPQHAGLHALAAGGALHLRA